MMSLAHGPTAILLIGVRKNQMEETRGITVKVRESLHSKAKQEAEAKEQTMSQFIEAVLIFYFNKESEKEMTGNKRTLAFQVSEEFFAEVQDYIKTNCINYHRTALIS